MEVEVEADRLKDESLDRDQLWPVILLRLSQWGRQQRSFVAQIRLLAVGSPSPVPGPPSTRLRICQPAIWISRSFLSVSSTLDATRIVASDTSCERCRLSCQSEPGCDLLSSPGTRTP